MKTTKHLKWPPIIFITAILINATQFLFAQGFSGELKWLRVGELQGYYSEQNSELESGGLNDINISFAWPAQYSMQQWTMRARGMWLGCKDFYDTNKNDILTYKVVGTGPRSDDDQPNQVFMPPEIFKLVGKYNHPIVIVDDALASVNTLYDVLDETDEDLVADRMLVVKTNTSIGVTVTKKVHAFTQQNHDNYFVCDYILKNTGIIDAEGSVYEQTLKDFVFCLNYRYSLAGESVRGYNDGWGIWNSAWGRNTVNDVVGTDPLTNDFEFSAVLAWYGPHSQRIVEDDWGCPNQTDDGVLATAKFAGAVALHADKSVQDRSNDRYQPRTTHYLDSDADICYNYSQFDELLMNTKYEAMTAGHADKTHAEEVGDGHADLWGPGIGGTSIIQGFGPYTLAPGDSIHIVVAEGVSGISREKNREVGGNWLQWTTGTGTPELVMPDGSTTTDHNNYKKAWVLTCRDSLMQIFRNAVSNLNAGYNIPQPPPPPDQFIIQSGGDRIRLSWTDNATSWPNFDGYVIYRSEGNVMQPESVYEKIFECGAPDAVHTFDDITAARGFDYYYYIQSKDDGSTNDVHPGVPLYSSLFWTVTSVPAYLRRPAGESLKEVRVVPNPYDLRARSLQFGDDFQYDRIAFYGLPPICDVKVFTERGDLIWEKYHDDGSGDELWDSLTSAGQIVVSGIYILYVETPEGESVFRKFVVIR